MRHIGVNVDAGQDGEWGNWTELGVLEPGEKLAISLDSENVQIGLGWHGVEAACRVPASGIVGPFDILTRASARVRQASRLVQGDFIES